MNQNNNNILINLDHFVWLNGNHHSNGLLAIGAKDSISLSTHADSFEQLRSFFNQHKGQYVFGYLAFDLKNAIEDLVSTNPDTVEMPEAYFFVPKTVLSVTKSNIGVYTVAFLFGAPVDLNHFTSLLNTSPLANKNTVASLEPAVTKQEYLDAVEAVKKQLQLGNIYEMNYCYAYTSSNCDVDPWSLYLKMNQLSNASFSSFAKLQSNYILSASPERFFKKEGQKISSQPIKGTIKRGVTAAEDMALIQQLKNDKKELRENIMIVDLVRNDLSKIAQKGSVSVDELCEIYTFDTLHQMISSVSCQLDTKYDLVDLLTALFPMGSMTGVPKIKALELIESIEATKRGVYSGSLGYIAPNGDADFNVLIRTFLYNSLTKNLAYSVGSAITFASNPEAEYNETLLKAKLAFDSLVAKPL